MIYIFTVGEISQHIKLMLERELSHIQIKGEIILLKKHTSGNIYFSLKDDSASLDCVLWKNTRMGFKLTEGMKIICKGKISSYAGRSKYQMIVKEMKLDGLGDIMLQIEESKQKLLAEGLFKSEKKLKLPKFPNKIGIITSFTGAVVHDMLHRLNDRYHCDVYIYNTLVQGDTATREIIQALDKAQHVVDIVVIARGGGSFEDLLCFYNEDLVRTISKSKIPVVTAIGHETDTTLADYAASLRAPTPTAAIEMITPDRDQLFVELDQFAIHMSSIVTNAANDSTKLADTIDLYLDDDLISSFQKLDYISADLNRKYKEIFDQYILSAGQDINMPVVSKHNTVLESLDTMHQQIFEYEYKQHLQNTKHLINLCDTFSHKNTLKRGYCIAKHEDKIMMSSRAIKDLKRLELHFHDGACSVEKI